MGLYAYIDITRMGFPEQLEQQDARGEMQVVEVFYDDAIQAFIDAFMEVALDLVPVDTGYLESTIGADQISPIEAECYAEAEYAQYVEYGTWKMDAQPYFRPALEEGIRVLIEECQVALDWAQEEMQELLANIQEACIEAVSGGDGMFSASWGDFFKGQLMFTGVFVMFFPLFVYMYGILDTISTAIDGGSYEQRSGGYMPDIIIT